MSSRIAELRALVIDKGDWQRYFSDKLGVNVAPDGDGWSQKIICPFHDDTTPSLNVNIKTGGFKCHACPNTEPGSVFDFHNYLAGKSPKDKTNFAAALKELAAYAGVDIGDFARNNTTDVSSLPRDIKVRDVTVDIPTVSKADHADATKPPIALQLMEDFHLALMAEHYEYLSVQRGFSAATIERRRLGWHARAKYKNENGVECRGRYTIPIFSKDGSLRNIRKYHHDAIPAEKMINTSGYGSPPRIYPLHDLIANDWQHVFFCEGEFDCILLNQKLEEAGMNGPGGWGAITGTHGATTFLPEWLTYLWDRNVYFMFDVDETGKAQMSSHCTKYFLPFIKLNKFKSVKICLLPCEGNKNDKDVSDHFLKNGGTVDDIINIVHATAPLVSGGVSGDEATNKPVEVASFVDCVMNREYIDKRVRVPIAISGQTNKIYHAPREYQVSYCPAKANCCSAEVTGTRFVPYGHEIFIQACMATKAQMQKSLASVACTNGQKCQVVATSKVVMQEFFAHQVIQRWKSEENAEGKMINCQELVTAPVYVLQPEGGALVQPQNYFAVGWIRTHPVTQQAALFIETLEPIEDNWQAYEVDEANKTHLKKIRDLGVGEILEHIEKHVTRIYESDEILMTVLLTYLSPLGFNFNGEAVRGWINSCIIGDSGTGKSMTYQRISDWLELGDLFSVLTGTRTGLLYACKQSGGSEWYIHVGRYVTASGQIIAIDEAQETDKEELFKMSTAMDTGKLEVSQVAQGSYRTQTRTIFLMNPTGDKKISDYAYGCLALKACFIPRFIRRLDLVVFCTAKEEHGFYNQVNEIVGTTNSTPAFGFDPTKPSDKQLNALDFKSLVHWAWTRKNEHIIFPKDTLDACLQQARFLSEKYGYPDDIPLVDPMGYRKELARISVAFAILNGNFTDDFQSVVVLREHVETMAQFVDNLYSSASCNLLQHSKAKKKKSQMHPEEFEKIKSSFEELIKHSRTSPNREYAEANYFCQLLLLLQQQQEHGIRPNDLRQQLGGVSSKWVQQRMSLLKSFNLVDIKDSKLTTTQKFNKFMIRWTSDRAIETMLDEVYDKIGRNAATIDNTDEYNGRFNSPSPDESEFFNRGQNGQEGPF
jgi:hypothetical protein